MLHKCKMTILDKKLYPELQEAYCADPQSGPCPCYHVGDQYLFERYDGADDFWKMGAGTLIKATHGTDGVAGGPDRPHCSELWDAVSRYIYTALQGGSIMRGWMKDERVMIACCSDGTRPVIVKLERLDYCAAYLEGSRSRITGNPRGAGNYFPRALRRNLPRARPSGRSHPTGNRRLRSLSPCQNRPVTAA